MNLLKKLQKKIFGADLSPELVSHLAQETADKLKKEKAGFDFAAHHKALREYRLDAHIRAKVLSDRNYAHRTRPRMPQVAAKIVSIIGDGDDAIITLETGQQLRGYAQQNPAMRAKIQKAANS